MVDYFLGKKYKLASSHNFENFMKALGVGMLSRKLANVAAPIVDLQKEGDIYVLSSNSAFKNIVTKFIPGVEFTQETPDGRKVRAKIYMIDDNTLREVQKDENGKKTVIDRTFTDDELTMVMQVDGIKAVRLYKAKPSMQY